MKLFKKKTQKSKNKHNYLYRISVILDYEEMEKLSKHYIDEDNNLLSLRQLLKIMHSDEDSI
jgi:hypothetical protein